MADFLLSVQVPKVHLTFCDVSEAAYHQDVAEGADADGISEALAELAHRLAVDVVEGGRGWLLA